MKKNATISPDLGIRQFTIFLNFRMLFNLSAQSVFSDPDSLNPNPDPDLDI